MTAVKKIACPIMSIRYTFFLPKMSASLSTKGDAKTHPAKNILPINPIFEPDMPIHEFTLVLITS